MADGELKKELKELDVGCWILDAGCWILDAEAEHAIMMMSLSMVAAEKQQQQEQCQAGAEQL